MAAGAPATVGVSGQDAVIAGSVAEAGGQRQLDDSTGGTHIQAVLGAKKDNWLATGHAPMCRCRASGQSLVHIASTH